MQVLHYPIIIIHKRNAVIVAQSLFFAEVLCSRISCFAELEDGLATSDLVCFKGSSSPSCAICSNRDECFYSNPAVKR